MKQSLSGLGLKYFGILILFLFVPGAPVFCQVTDQTETPEPDWENTIESDGPDFTEASSVIPQGTIQLETGLMFTKDKQGTETTKTLAYPATLVRLGILKSAELRIIGEYNDIRTSVDEGEGEVKTAGLAPILIGTKIYVCEEKGLCPETSFIGHLLLPTGSRNLRPLFTAPEFRLSFANSLSNKIDIGYNIGYEWDGNSPKGKAIYTLAMGFSLSKRWSTYIEVYGDKPEGDPFAHNAAGGFKFLIAPNWQVDVSGGHGLNSLAPDYYLASGLRLRLPY